MLAQGTLCVHKRREQSSIALHFMCCDWLIFKLCASSPSGSSRSSGRSSLSSLQRPPMSAHPRPRLRMSSDFARGDRCCS
eukprot:2051144-Alexandrium_andersonii.AAC.1